MDQELLEKIAAVVAAHSPVSSGGVVAGSSSLATDGHASASYGAAPSSAAAGEDHTADDYLSVAFTPAKKIFRHCLKRAAQQCKAWGIKTLKELTPAELCHIHKEVALRCPPLAQKQIEVEKILSHCLSEAKYYRSRLARKKVDDIASASTGKKYTHKTDKSRQRKRKSVQKEGKTSKGKKKLKKCVIQEEKDMTTTDFGLPETGHQMEYSSSDDSDDRQEEQSSTSAKLQGHAGKFTPGTEVVLTHRGLDVGEGIFLLMENEMYAKVSFSKLCDLEGCGDIELPACVDGSGISTLGNLKKHSVFIWKAEKLWAKKRDPIPNRRYL